MGKCLFLRKGETHTAPISGILASEFAVGSSVYLMESGTAAEYLVVHQGLPSSMYDASCDGTWLLRRYIYESRKWHSVNYNDYGVCDIRGYLNSDFLSLFDENAQSAIKEVKIPYANGAGNSPVSSGANGLAAKIFLLSGYEVGWTQSTHQSFLIDGACLSYFSGTAAIDSKRIGYLDGTATKWWLRSPQPENTKSAWNVSDSGAYASGSCITSLGIRPALVLPSNALFDKNTLILKGVA